MFPGIGQIAKPFSLPVPMKGMNGVDSLQGRSPEESIYAFNLIPAQYGLNVRSGWQEWATNVTGTGGVRTLIPTMGMLTSQDRLFAATVNGLYEVTGSTSAPTLRYAFGITTGDAGWSSWASFATTAAQFIPMCDEANGYFIYDPVANTFATPTFGGGAGQVSGVNPALLGFVTSYKNRLWFIEQGTSRAWYLPTGLTTGAATLFDFGNKFLHGGSLAGLYSFTIDGGVGSEDYLVAIGTAGDVVVYMGTDPSAAATFDQKGIWYLSDMPAGRRLATAQGGELFILSVYGLISLRTLMSGADVTDPNQNVTRNITPFIATDMLTMRTQRGWECVSFPAENLRIIFTPKQTGQSYRAYVQNVITGGWGIYRDLPCQTSVVWNGKLYLGTSDNKVLIHQGDLDGLTLAGTGAVEINWSLLTTYQGDYTWKIPSMVRLYFIALQNPSYSVRVLFDFALTEPAGNTPYSSSVAASLWDVALWDQAFWGGDSQPFVKLAGLGGIGKYMALAIKGSSISDTRLVAIDVAAMSGGFL